MSDLQQEVTDLIYRESTLLDRRAWDDWIELYTEDARFERKVSAADQPYFVLTATNGQTIGKSQMYSGAAAMENGIESVKSNAPGAALNEVE